MKKQPYYFLQIILISVLYFLYGCENKTELTDENHLNFTQVPNFIELVDDSTDIAGTLNLSIASRHVDLIWNIPTGCNVDTSQTVVTNKSGIFQIPIKWLERNEVGTYGSKTRAFDGGVLVSDGNISKYVHLIWADKIDTVQYSKDVLAQTRNGASLRAEIVLEVTPETVNMDKVIGGGIHVNFSGISTIYVDQSNIAESTNILKDSIPLFLNEVGIIPLKWKDDKAPDSNFSTMLNLTAGNIVKTVYINYTPPYEEPTVWEFLSSSSVDGGMIPATDAAITIQVKTNNLWSLECTDGLISPVTDTTTGIGNKTLTMYVSNNPGNTPRTITILVKSGGTTKKTLTFVQLGNNGEGGDTGTVFTYVSSEPTDKAVIPATEGGVTVKVNTDYAWWIDLNGTKSNFPASALGEKSGTILLPANTGATSKTVTVTIGHGTTTVKTLTFTQLGTNGEIGTTFTFVSSEPVDNAVVPVTGSDVTVKVNTDYAWWIDLNGTKKNFPAGDLGEKTGTITIPAHTEATDKTITVGVGHGTTTVKTLTFTQPGTGGGGGLDGELTYVSSNLPTGNIPSAGKVYTFTFTGDYTGNFRVRAMDATTNAVINNGPNGTTLTPKVTVTANTAATTKNIKFQYRKTDVATAQWTDLPASTNRIQDANTGGGGETGTVTPGTLGPDGDLSEYGDNCSCTFDGDFTGTIIMRARAGELELARSTGKVNSTLTVQIPELDGMDRTITFEYSLDGGKTWIFLGTKKQINETFLPGEIRPIVDKISAGGGEFSWSYSGTYSKEVKFEIATVEPDGTYKVLSLQSSNSARTFTYKVPANTGTKRSIGFRYKRETKSNWDIILVLVQDGAK